MSRKVMKRKASDNEYLHKDFHGALSCGIEYLHQRFGPDAATLFLRNFARSFYAPLRERIKNQGLRAIREHYEQVYAIEGGKIQFTATEDELVLRVAACPAVQHMRSRGYPVARLFHETINTALCEGTCFDAELLKYDPETGRSVQRFFRRPS